MSLSQIRCVGRRRLIVSRTDTHCVLEIRLARDITQDEAETPLARLLLEPHEAARLGAALACALTTGETDDENGPTCARFGGSPVNGRATEASIEYKGLPGPDDSGVSMLSVFGCHEMETAARRILDRCRKRQMWAVVLAIDDFADDPYALLGFVMLTAYGWVIPRGEPNWAFRLSRAFVERVTSAKAKRYDRKEPQ